MNFFTRENITAKLPGFALFIIYCPVFNLAPGNELAALAFASLIKFLCIQYVARKGKKAFLLIKTWPLYIIAASNLVVSGFCLMNSDPKIYIAGSVICLVSAGVGGCYTIPLPQNAASSEGTEFESPYNDEKVNISV